MQGKKIMSAGREEPPLGCFLGRLTQLWRRICGRAANADHGGPRPPARLPGPEHPVPEVPEAAVSRAAADMPDSDQALVNRASMVAAIDATDEAGNMEAEIRRLRKLLSFYESLVDELPTPIFAKTIKSRFCLCNKSYEQFFGVQRENLLGRTLKDTKHMNAEERERYQEEDVVIIREGHTRHYETEYDTPRGKRQAMYWSKGFGDRALGTWAQVGMIVDISEQVALKRNLAAKVEELWRVQQKLRYLSRSDALTGLANRRPFAEYLTLGMDLARRKQIPMCMLMADIDHFKNINDTYGHDTGDMILRAIAGMLRSSCRSKDLAARIGGEEFVILLAATRLEDAFLVARRIRANIGDTPLLPDGGHATISIGVAQYRANETAKDFIKRVDAAMYRAKAAGRNQVCRG